MVLVETAQDLVGKGPAPLLEIPRLFSSVFLEETLRTGLIPKQSCLFFQRSSIVPHKTNQNLVGP